MTLKIGPESLKQVILAFPDDVAMHLGKVHPLNNQYDAYNLSHGRSRRRRDPH